ncbi:MAG: ATP-binding cassette domain-containing protein [Bryobacteraceae bacterium]
MAYAASDMAAEKSVDLEAAPLLEVRHLTKSYVRERWRRSGSRIFALQDVHLKVMPGSCLAVVGRSGSGKSTLGKCLARLIEPDSGEIWFDGENLLQLRSNEAARIRPKIQLLMQHSAASMNPRLSALELVCEPLLIQGQDCRKQRRDRALAMMEQVGIPLDWAHRSPLELSGGQRQRLAIARALILKPAFLILDEALSGLDTSAQAAIANMFIGLQHSLSLSYLFISHDLRMAAYVADHMAVIEHGRIVECGTVGGLFSRPQHPETKELISSIPHLTAQAGKER